MQVAQSSLSMSDCTLGSEVCIMMNFQQVYKRQKSIDTVRKPLQPTIQTVL